MTTYTTLTNAALAVGAIPSASKVQALRDNPIAIAEQSSGAPVNVCNWHPVDKVTIGDGKQGIIYDSALSGAQSSIVTSDFEDGWEYRIFGVGVSPSASASLLIDYYMQTEAAYRNATTFTSTGTAWDFNLEIDFPRIAKRNHVARFWSAATTLGTATRIHYYDSTSQKILRVRVRYSGENITAGKIWLFRRREFASAD